MRPQFKVLMTAGALLTASLGAAAPASAATTTAPAPSASAATSGTWAATGSMNTTRFEDTSTLLPDGQVLVAGGDSALAASAELYNPATGTSFSVWRARGDDHAGLSGQVPQQGDRRLGAALCGSPG